MGFKNNHAPSQIRPQVTSKSLILKCQGHQLPTGPHLEEAGQWMLSAILNSRSISCTSTARPIAVRILRGSPFVHVESIVMSGSPFIQCSMTTAEHSAKIEEA